MSIPHDAIHELVDEARRWGAGEKNEATLKEAREALEREIVGEVNRLAAALREFRAAFANNGRTSSLRDWNEGLKRADADAEAALAGLPLSEREPR